MTSNTESVKPVEAYRCGNCNLVYYDVHEACPSCWTSREDASKIDFEGEKGIVHSATARTGESGTLDPFLMVDMECGIRMVGPLAPDTDSGDDAYSGQSDLGKSVGFIGKEVIAHRRSAEEIASAGTRAASLVFRLSS